MHRRIFIKATAATVALAAAAAVIGCGGGGGSASGGGGGAGGGGTTSVSGRVVTVESGQPPASSVTITRGGANVPVNADGTFTVSGVAAGPLTLMIASAGEQTRTVTVTVVAGKATNLGDVYLSSQGYTANVTGRVVTTVNNGAQPVANAVVMLGNVSATTDTNGAFSMSGLPIGLGNVSGTFGTVKAAGFDVKPITADNLRFPLAAGANNIGDLLIAVGPGSSPPSLPYTIKGTVTVGGAPASGISVALSSGDSALGSATTDATGTYFFWTAAGAYTISASSTASPVQSVQVTLQQPDQPVTAPTIALPK